MDDIEPKGAAGTAPDTPREQESADGHDGKPASCPNEAICLMDPAGRLTAVNAAFLNQAGKPATEVVGLRCWEAMHPKTGPLEDLPAKRALRSRQPEFLELAQGARTLEVTADPLMDGSGEITAFIHIVRDITERKQDEQRYRNLNRIHRVMSAISHSIVRTHDPLNMFHDACRIAVEAGGFRMAWIGILDRNIGRVEPVAHAGMTGDYLEKLTTSLYEEPFMHGPTATALQTGRHAVCNDIEHDPIMAPWRERALGHGYRSSIALPLILDGTPCGTINLYAETRGFFDEEEQQLLVGLSEDISFALELAEREKQRQLTEQSLVETTERLTTVMDSINALVYVADLETYEILFINKYGRDLWGDVAGKSCWEVFHLGQTEPCSFCPIDKLLKDDGTPAGIFAWEDENSVTGKWYDRRDQVIRWHDGRLVHLQVATDITEPKQIIKSLAENEARLHTLLETIPDLVWLKDPEGVFLACNPMFERLLGAKAADLIGKTDYDFLEKELADFFRENDRKAIAAGKPITNNEWVTFADDGHRALLETTKTPMFAADGTLIGVLGIARDITEQRKLEEQLHHSQKMESIGTLAGGIAHDFNNILTAIIGYAQIMLMSMPESDPQRQFAGQIQAAAQRAAHLTKDLLLFSRKQSSERKVIDLNDTIRKLDTFLKRVIRADIAYETGLNTTPLPVMADSNQLELVMMNLATNASDAMPDGGTLTVTSRRFRMDESFVSLHGYGKPGDYALVTVSDTGQGMDEPTRKRIFEPFFTTKEVGKGTGLGLAVVYGIVKQHEGFINVYSEPGLGTSFRIYLPMVTAEPLDAAEPSQLVRPPSGTETIMLAEDDEMVRTLTASVLQEYGYRVITAADGAEAVRTFAEHCDAIDMIILDMIMPNLNGHEVLEQAREMRPGIKAIFVSGYGVDSVRHKLLDGRSLVLSKPITPTELLLAVRNLLDENTPAG